MSHLGVSRPVGKGFQSLPHFIILQDVKGAENDVLFVEDLDDLFGESTSRFLGRTLERAERQSDIRSQPRIES